MSAVDLQLIERLGWPIAAPEAWPAVMRLQPRRTPRSANAEELVFLDACLRAIPESRAGHRYAPGKWSIREVVGHICDAERVFLYRALRFARNDSTPLPGFDENAFVSASRFDDRALAGLVAEFEAVRAATVPFFDALYPEEWTRHGTASGKGMSVRGLAWVIAGHELHHLDVLGTRYL